MNSERRPAPRNLWPGWLALALYTWVMFYLASAPASMFPRLPPLIPWDKFVHGGEWALWGTLLFLTLRRQFPGLDPRRGYGWTVGCAAVVALLHELYQIPVPGRSCDPLDWTADMIGVIIALVILIRFLPRVRRASL